MAIRRLVLATLLWAALLGAVPGAANENWPQFRGPLANGHADAQGLPIKWSESENIAWKTPIHDFGWSSPVIWNDAIWLTTATADGQHSFAVCVDRASGKIVHDIKVFDTEKPIHVAAMNSYASPTPVIEAGRLYVHYGTYGTACLDTETGNIIWTRRDLNCDHHEGPGSSPMLWGNLLIFNVDGRDVQYVVALDKATGKTVWKTKRSVDYSKYHENMRKAFCTPIVIESDGRLQLISPGGKAMMGYDPGSGEELWKLRYQGWSITPRPLFGHGLIYLVNDYDHPELWAVRPGGTGELSESNVVWKITKAVPNRPSLLLIDDLLYMVSSTGIASCVEADTGRVLWQEKLRGNFSASPVYADGRIYIFNQEAIATVLLPRRTYSVAAVNELDGEELMASPAVSGNALFVRTKSHLYRIEKRG